jgi:hypothetical protein
MEPIAVSTQAEYDEAQKFFQKAFDESYFDLSQGKGIEMAKEVNDGINGFFYKDAPSEDIKKALARFYFTAVQASDITDYFIRHKPESPQDIERGLNFLNLKSSREFNLGIPLIHIKEAQDKICVWSPVEVYGKSQVEAFGSAKATAYNRARVISHDQAVVEALDNSLVVAFDQSYVVSRNESNIRLNDEATGLAYDCSSVYARDHANIVLFDKSYGNVSDSAIANAFHKASVTATKKAIIFAFNDSKVAAYDDSKVTARNRSYIDAQDSAVIDAQDQSVTIAGENVKVSAQDNSLIILQGEAVCESCDKSKVIKSSQNKPAFLEKNVLSMLDHPFINKNPSTAINLLLAAIKLEDINAFNRKLKKMGCVDPQSTSRVLSSLENKFDQTVQKKQGPEKSWER